MIFEPAKSNCEFLAHKFCDNSNVTVERYAVSNQSGDATLFSNEDGSGLSSLTQRRLDYSEIYFDSKENITTIRFEDYWKESLGCHHIDFCKIDID